jgi:hypothetical protein
MGVLFLDELTELRRDSIEACTSPSRMGAWSNGSPAWTTPARSGCGSSAGRGRPPRTLADRHGARRTRQRHRLPRVGVVFLADLDEIDRPRESRLVGIRITTVDVQAPRGIEPALDVGPRAGSAFPRR